MTHLLHGAVIVFFKFTNLFTCHFFRQAMKINLHGWTLSFGWHLLPSSSISWVLLSFYLSCPSCWIITAWKEALPWDFWKELSRVFNKLLIFQNASILCSWEVNYFRKFSISIPKLTCPQLKKIYIYIILDEWSFKFVKISLFIGLLGSLYSFLQFLSSPLAGCLSDRYGRKPALLVSMVRILFNIIGLPGTSHLIKI